MHKHGAVSVPSRYGALIGVMREMHWSWQDVMSAPADLVEVMTERIAALAYWAHQKSDCDTAMSNG